MKRILVLDDDSNRHAHFKKVFSSPDVEVTHVFTHNQALRALESSEKFDLVHLDHDLNDYGARSYAGVGDEMVELTGYHVALFIARELNEAKRPTQVIIHSWNPSGARMMEMVIRQAGIPVTYEPYAGPMKGEFDEGATSK